MQIIWDNLAATFIALGLVLVLVAMQFRVGQVSADRTSLYAAKKQTLEFADVLTRELSNIGSRMPEGERITNLSKNEYNLTDTLAFSRVNKDGDTLRVAYVVVPADTIAIEDTTAILYRMLRYENDVQDGSSTPTLRDFRIELLDDVGVDVGMNYDETRQVRISLSSQVPFGDAEDHYVQQTFWGTTLRPNTLR